MRILILNWWDWENPNAGGAEVYCREIFRRVAHRGHEVMLLCAHFPGAKREETLDGIEIIRGGNNVSQVFRAWRFLHGHPQSFDVIVDFTNKVPYFTPFYVRKPILGVIFHINGPIFNAEFGTLGAILRQFELPILSLYRRNITLTISESTKAELIRARFAQARITVASPGTFKQKTSTKALFPLLVYLGRLKKYKKIELILKAFQTVLHVLPNAHMLILGEGNDFGRLEYLSRALGIDQRVTFLGRVSEDEKQLFLGKAWLLLQPSLKEGWGIAILEAGSLGTPTLASDVPGLKDAIIHKKTGWLIENSVHAFTTALLRLLLDPEHLYRAGRAAQHFARGYSWDKSAERVLNILKKLVG